jgi:hypothetical protein
MEVMTDVNPSLIYGRIGNPPHENYGIGSRFPYYIDKWMVHPENQRRGRH